MHVIVTGAAGFIGGHLCRRLLERGDTVWGVDNFDTFYAPAVKRLTAGELVAYPRFHLVEADLCDLAATTAALLAAGAEPARVDALVHLAARAGVRPSIEHPLLYARVNVEGTAAALELGRTLRVPGFVFGSSSSVYGNAAAVPFSEADPVAAPISPYAASKRAGELLCHTYAHLYGTATVCLRFFTVYGPRQRPDLAIHKFTRLLAAGEAIPLFGDGATERDYTWVDDILQGIEGALAYVAAHPGAFEIVNLGESRTVPLRRLVELLGAALELEPRIEWLPEQPGDVRRTCADVSRARALLGYAPSVAVEEGIQRFVAWFRGAGAAAAATGLR